ncbi:MAG: nicotinate-nucleotide adenylyltransferase [Clostridiales Family XIII bacterium]|jgi:nicotinate-nucleotide adenylyltransferase|nr:nicotinate-nucleotide adenylyltransferase [Clostridiales Family XIII bacterium]
MAKLGVLGGSFDPVHYGHLLLAEEALEQAGLDRVIFMPTHVQPFKQDASVSPVEDRLAMLSLAVGTHEKLGITTVEIDEPGVSYTIFSLRKLREEANADDSIWFILGADMFVNLHKWYLSNELLTEFSFVAGMRPGSDQAAFAYYAAKLNVTYETEIAVIENRQFDVSSTEIRQRVRERRSVRYLIPDPVREYIDAHGLYT